MTNIKFKIGIVLLITLCSCSNVERKEFFYEVVGSAVMEKELNKDQNTNQDVDLGYGHQRCLSVKSKCSGSYTEWLQSSNETACRCVKSQGL